MDRFSTASFGCRYALARLKNGLPLRPILCCRTTPIDGKATVTRQVELRPDAYKWLTVALIRAATSSRSPCYHWKRRLSPLSSCLRNLFLHHTRLHLQPDETFDIVRSVYMAPYFWSRCAFNRRGTCLTSCVYFRNPMSHAGIIIPISVALLSIRYYCAHLRTLRGPEREVQIWHEL